ncbi:phosphoribosyltransferase [Variovorax sp. dw_954]|uniref:phosphoribosyltransferase n=1 Tax=Variovorax sp. dw_954 TaxID=2720078 RepID=UPI001BD2F9AA|nr:phosphoribosyltransferase [Variovorax sp. dw_954]
MNSPVHQVSYSKIEQLVGHLVDRLAEVSGGERFDAVVGIVRGGVVPATMFSQRLGAELVLLRAERHQARVEWLGEAPPPGSRTLLVDDIASRGTTLSLARAFVEAAGCRVTTCTLFVDRDRCVTPPDLALDAPGFVRYPWDRRETTPAARQFISQYEMLSPAAEAEFVGVDLDGILLRDIHRSDYERDLLQTLGRRADLPPRPHLELPPVDWQACHVITARPQQDYQVTRAWLDRHGFEACGLSCRDSQTHSHTIDGAVAHKAQALLRLGISLFIESDLQQTVMLAGACPTVDVVWWGRFRRLRIGGVSQVVLGSNTGNRTLTSPR